MTESKVKVKPSAIASPSPSSAIASPSPSSAIASPSPSSAINTTDEEEIKRVEKQGISEREIKEIVKSIVDASITKLKNGGYIENQIEEQLTRLKDQELKTVRDEITSIKDRVIPRVEKDIRATRDNAIKILGVFVALFSFVSIDFNILNGSDDFTFSGALILIAGGLLLSFLLIMDIILNPEYLQDNEGRIVYIKPSIKFSSLWLIVLFLLGFGVIFMYESMNNKGTKLDNNKGLNINIDNTLKSNR